MKKELKTKKIITVYKSWQGIAIHFINEWYLNHGPNVTVVYKTLRCSSDKP